MLRTCLRNLNYSHFPISPQQLGFWMFCFKGKSWSLPEMVVYPSKGLRVYEIPQLSLHLITNLLIQNLQILKWYKIHGFSTKIKLHDFNVMLYNLLFLIYSIAFLKWVLSLSEIAHKKICGEATLFILSCLKLWS